MSLKESLKKLETRFGKGTVMKMSDKPLDAPRVTSGSLKLNIALGGGYAKGKIIEIFSEEACGKTGLALELVREVQNGGGTAAIIDAEHALNPEYVESIGVNFSEVYISQPESGEMAFEIAREFLRSGEIDIIVFDSVSALTPKSEIEGETGESKMGAQARMMSQAMRQITGAAANSECTLVFLNQLREKIGVMFGDPRVTSGGKALKFFASQRLSISKSPIKDGKDVIGFTQKIQVVKNKVGVPFKKMERDIIYETGADVNGELLDVAVDLGIVEKNGSWFNYGETKLGQGAAKVLDLFDDNEELKNEVEIKVLEKLAGE
jgi:recombination protein RecA